MDNMGGAVKLRHWEPGGWIRIGWVFKIMIRRNTQVEEVDYKLIKDRLRMIDTSIVQGQMLEV